MRYRENREQTAELLRMVLPLMSRHAAGFHPLSYAVWYEYASGTNQSLRSAIDTATGSGRRLNDVDIQELFDRHVARRDIESSMRLRARIQQVVEQVTEATSQASDEVGRYNDGLNEYQQRLQRDIDREAIGELVHSLVLDTTRVLDRTTDLRHNLQVNTEEARRLRAELEAVHGQAMLDPLTGLLNARGLEHRVASLYSLGLPEGALLQVEIDNFRGISDSYGHLLGDRVIASVAQIVSTVAGAEALTARAGAEQFTVLMPGKSPQLAAETAERIRSGVEKCRIRRQESDATVEAVTVSIGVGANASGETLAAAIIRADGALYRARQDGRNRITISGGD
jgi:diguanylate cyclase